MQAMQLLGADPGEDPAAAKLVRMVCEGVGRSRVILVP